MKSLCLLAFALFAISLEALEINRDFTIVTGKLSSDPEIRAASILSSCLEKVFGAGLKTVKEEEHDGKSPAIFIGDTNYAAERQIHSAQFGEEEHYIRADEKNLIVCGGKPRGLLYAVYEVLEQFAGCTKLTPVDDYIPRKESFTVPEGKAFRGQPFFQMRQLRIASLDEKVYQFFSWHKINNHAALNPKFMRLYNRYSDCGSGHSFFSYSNTFPQNRPELFSMNAKGIRERATSFTGPGQFCLSNPEVRKLVKKEVARRIARYEKICREQGCPPPAFYNIATNDNSSYCRCPGCKALMKKYGNVFSGALIDFINDIAGAFPEQRFQTFAYQISQEPPSNIRARDNVIIQFAMQCVIFRDADCDLTRPLEHPFNRKVMNRMRQWQKVAKHFAVWQYGDMHNQTSPSPYTVIPTLPQNFRFYAGIGASGLLSETCYQDLNRLISPPAFYDLQVYMTAKLMENPYLDDQALITDFMEKFYGPAAGKMMEYYRFLIRKMSAEDKSLCSVAVEGRDYLAHEFFHTVEKLLDEAEYTVRNDNVYLNRVRQERIPVDFALLHLWNRLEMDRDRNLNLTRKSVIDRLENILPYSLNKYLGRENRPKLNRSLKQAEEREAARIMLLRNPIPVPPQFADEVIVQYSMLQNGSQTRYLAPDADALYGKALVLKKTGNPVYDTPELHRKPFVTGIYDATLKKNVLKKRFSPEELKQDEKYHLYYLGRTAIPGEHKLSMYAHWTWTLRTHHTLQMTYSWADADREYDIYLSLKFTGPAYVKGSKKENAVYLDRVIYVKKGTASN